MKIKLLASLLSIMMIFSMLTCATVSAEVDIPANIGEDYVPGEVTGNKYDVVNEAIGTTLLSNSTKVGFSANLNNDMVFSSNQVIGDGVEAINANQAFGAQVATAYVDWTDLHVNGKTFIVGAQVKKLEGSPRITAGFTEAPTNGDPNRIGDRANGYEVYEGFEITSTEYAPVCLTMTMTKARANMNYTTFAIGFPEDPPGTTSVEPRSFAMKPGSLFIGFEAAHDINVSADTTKWIPGETEEINLDCDIVNQVGVPGTLNQEVKWYAMNAERTEIVDGITITESGNSDGKATIVVDQYTVPAGNYAIVAVSEENSEFIKGIEIEVEYSPVLVELNLTKSGDIFTANAKLMTCDSEQASIKAIVILVGLDEHDEVIDYKVQQITSTYSESNVASTATKSLTATSSVHHVNAFLWETTNVDTPDVLDTTLKELAPMKTLNK